MKHVFLTALMTFALTGVSHASPESAHEAYTSGQQRLRANDLAAAETLFSAAVAEAPDNTLYLSDLGRVYSRTGKDQAAVPVYKHMCEIIQAKYGALSSRMFGCNMLWGKALAAVKDATAADQKYRDAFTAALAQQPRANVDCLIALHFVATNLNMLGRLEEAVPLYEQLLAQNHESEPDYLTVEAAVTSVRAGKIPGF